MYVQIKAVLVGAAVTAIGAVMVVRGALFGKDQDLSGVGPLASPFYDHLSLFFMLFGAIVVGSGAVLLTRTLRLILKENAEPDDRNADHQVVETGRSED